MSTDRFPEGVAVGPEDFRRCGWREALAGAKREGYSAMWQVLSGAARQAIEEGRNAEGKVLWLLADACSMMLRPASLNEPFKPILVMNGKRSALPEDLATDHVELFAQVVDEIDDAWLRARLADLVWLLKQPRDVRFALLAIDAYRQVPLETETWVRGGHECRDRAVRLAITLGKVAVDRLREMEAEIVAAVKNARAEDGFLGLWLAVLLDETGLGRACRGEVAAKLETLAMGFDAEGNLHRAREYFNAAAKWYGLAGDEDKTAAMSVNFAEGWVKEAVARMSGEKPSHMVGATFLQNAIHAYRRIPTKKRPEFRADERIAELHQMMTEAGEKSLGEMGRITSPSIDISELVENARRAVGGKLLREALAAFADIYPGVRFAKLRQSAIDLLRQHPLQALFPATVLSRDGRVIARRPGMSMGAEGDPQDDAAIWAEIVKHYSIEVGLVVQGDIWPALETLTLEHRLTERDMTAVAESSPVVPPQRERFFGKGLYAGFERDFVSAMHLLVPQVEHMVRWHLRQRGEKTTTLDAQGIENEIGLSALLEKAAVNEIFGEDLAFELRAVFADPFGPNLRNKVAHGLLEYDAAQSVFAIYAWWWVFRLVFKTFLRGTPGPEGGNSAKPNEDPPQSSEGQAK